MAPLVVLIVTFLLVYGGNRLLAGGRLGMMIIGRIALSAMLLVTGVAHFTSTDLMVAMMPEAIPFKLELVYFTGVCELAAAIGLLWDRTSRLAAIMLAIFFLMVLPANIAGSLKRVELGGMENGPIYLWFRVPLQMFLIWWTWHFGIRNEKKSINRSSRR